MIGKLLSHYKIESELGRGGMGIVYRAKDTKLDRTVAIKVLPSAALSSDDDRARFYREAKAAAQLHHPHIASIFEIDEAVPEGANTDDLRPFIAMEFVAGETLEDRIKKGPMKLDEAIRIAVQIASGLEVAHEKEIVHRDIKSANVMLSEKNNAKILDFGLAQTAASTKLTRMGSTLGTVAYMSPEQARGEEVDGRSDIWALGVILYEMIAGLSPFPGDYEQAVVYAILNQDAEPLTAVRSGVPMELERIAAKCLSKQAGSRYQSARDLIVDLENVDAMASRMSRISTAGASATLASKPDVQPSDAQSNVLDGQSLVTPIRAAVAAALGIVLLAGGIAVGALFFGASDTPTTSGHFSIEVPVVAEIGPFGPYSKLAFSPDGEYFAYSSGSEQFSIGTVYLRRRNDPSVRAITSENEVAADLFFSEDGRQLGYYDLSENTFKSVEIPDGSPRTIGAGPVACCVGITWGPEAQIVYGSYNTGLFELSPDGKTTRQITFPDPLQGERTHRFPHFIKGTNDLLFTVGKTDDRSWDQASIAHYSAESGTHKILLPGGRDPRYIPTGHIIYGREGSLFAVAFDPATATVNGNPVRLDKSVAMSEVYGRVEYTVDEIGTLAYIKAGQREDPTHLNWYSRKGDLIEILDSTRNYHNIEISPDGLQVLTNVASANDHVWIRDRESGRMNPFTISGNNLSPTWSPDGTSITYLSSNMGQGVLHEDVDKSAPPRLLMKREGALLSVPNWSPDGQFLAHADTNEDGFIELKILNPEDESTITYGVPGANVSDPLFSPDGKWLAFASDELGIVELYVARFPEFTDRKRISSGGAIKAMWHPNGTEFFYWRDMDLLRVPIEYDGRPSTSGEVLFSLANEGVFVRSFDYDPEIDQFLVVLKLGVSPIQRVDVVVNWFETLKNEMGDNN